jgi:hypothetical protein
MLLYKWHAIGKDMFSWCLLHNFNMFYVINVSMIDPSNIRRLEATQMWRMGLLLFYYDYY